MTDEELQAVDNIFGEHGLPFEMIAENAHYRWETVEQAQERRRRTGEDVKVFELYLPDRLVQK